MRTPHYIAIAAGIGLVALLYFGARTTPKNRTAPAVTEAGHEGHDHEHDHEHEGPMPMMGSQIAPASTDSLLTAAHKALSGHAAEDIRALEKQIKETRDSAAMAPLFDSVGNVWQQHNQFYAAAYARENAARLAKSEKRLNFAGQFFLDVAQVPAAPSVQRWAVDGALRCFQQALDINPDNDTTRLALAAAYVDGSGEVMQGVALLKEITAKDPDNIPANLMLGRMSIQSGQLDKAVQRFETVLKQEPENREALYFLAEAYRGKGDKTKAIATLDKLKKIVKDPNFSKDIDEYIKSF